MRRGRREQSRRRAGCNTTNHRRRLRGLPCSFARRAAVGSQGLAVSPRAGRSCRLAQQHRQATGVALLARSSCPARSWNAERAHRGTRVNPASGERRASAAPPRRPNAALLILLDAYPSIGPARATRRRRRGVRARSPGAGSRRDLADEHQAHHGVALDRALGRVADAAVDAHDSDATRTPSRSRRASPPGLDVGALASLLALRRVLRSSRAASSLVAMSASSSGCMVWAIGVPKSGVPARTARGVEGCRATPAARAGVDAPELSAPRV